MKITIANRPQRPYSTREAMLALLLLCLALAWVFPELVALQKAAMSGEPWTLKDPTVSWTAFMPGLREFRYELFNHGNILWSNLRGMGQPMLANGVQAAPLFPLNLALIGLPDTLYWSVMPLLRIVLIAFACYLIARHCFGLSVTASLVFALLAGMNLHVLRWINHPWSNGILAGLWYLYFNCRLLNPVDLTLRQKIGFSVGLMISVFAMVTAGFPEASAVSALFAGALFLGVLLAQWSRFRTQLKHALLMIIVCHVVGFAFSAIQLFALLEYIDVSHAMALREGYISRSFTPQQVKPYWFSQLSIFWLSPLQRTYLNFNSGLLGLCLALTGVIALLANLKDRRRLILSITFVCLMLLFTAKSFGWSQIVDAIFAHTPVLAQSHFPLYFSPLFYFGLAFFAALGTEYLISQFTLLKRVNWRLSLWLIAMTALILYLIVIAIELFNQVPALDIWHVHVQGRGFNNLLFFGLAMMLLLSLTLFPNRRFSPHAASFIVILALVLELSATMQKNFANPGSTTLYQTPAITDLIDKAIAAAPVPRHELRSSDQLGSFVQKGIATIDNGISAMLPPDQRLIRRALFHTQYGGYFPLESAKNPWSFDALSNNLHIVHTEQVGVPDWRDAHHDESLQPVLLDWNRSIEIMRDNPLLLRGRISTNQQKSSRLQVWIHLHNQHESIWLSATIHAAGSGGESNNPLSIDWGVKIPTYKLKSKAYQFTVRLFDPARLRFDDTGDIPINFRQQYHFDQPTRPKHSTIDHSSDQLLAVSDAGNYQIYFRPGALPRAYTAKSCSHYADKQEIVAFIANSNAISQGEVALLQDRSWPALDCKTLNQHLQRVAIKKDNGTQIQLDKISGPALLVLNDLDYPGWHVRDTLSQSFLSIRPANLATKAVFLPEPREYQLQFHYRPAWLTWVYLLLVAGLMLAGWYFTWLFRTRR